ncbi:MAG TPA: M48 family peptidase [Methylophaga sp.]|nr:M48 family peptidase [Methylophaga sp.]
MTHNKNTYQFRYGDELIVFERINRNSATRRILIKVHADCRVIVQAANDASDDDVLQAVKKRSRWIYKKLNAFKEQLRHVIPRQYVSGESHFYLGRRYMLKVMVDPNSKPQVKLLRGRFEVTLRKSDPIKVKELLNSWYRVRAKAVFQRQLMAIMDKTLWVKEVPPIRVFAMETQWGSCSPNGRLTLNPKLVKANRECIDYVILHELCHLVEHNHSERFYKLINQVMPDWQKVKLHLDQKYSIFS